MVRPTLTEKRAMKKEEKEQTIQPIAEEKICNKRTRALLQRT